MATPPRYWSLDFVKAFVEALKADPEFRKAAGSFSQTLQLRCLDTPDGQDVQATYRFVGGRLAEVRLVIEEAPSEAIRDDPFDAEATLARATAPYPVWVKLDRGEMSVMQALASPDYRIEGPMLKLLPHLAVFNGMNAVAARVDKQY